MGLETAGVPATALLRTEYVCPMHPEIVRGWQSVVTWNLNMFTLIGLRVSVAWAYSLVALIMPAIFPPSMRHEGGTVPVYFEAAAVITALVLLGQVLELRARSHQPPPGSEIGVDLKSRRSGHLTFLYPCPPKNPEDVTVKRNPRRPQVPR